MIRMSHDAFQIVPEIVVVHGAGHFPQSEQTFVTDLIAEGFPVPHEDFAPFHRDEFVDFPSFFIFCVPLFACKKRFGGIASEFAPFRKRFIPRKLPDEREFLLVETVDDCKNRIVAQRCSGVGVYMFEKRLHRRLEIPADSLVEQNPEFCIEFPHAFRPRIGRAGKSRRINRIDLNIDSRFSAFRDTPVKQINFFRIQYCFSILNRNNSGSVQTHHIAAVAFHLPDQRGDILLARPERLSHQLPLAVILTDKQFLCRRRDFRAEEAERNFRCVYARKTPVLIDNHTFNFPICQI